MPDKTKVLAAAIRTVMLTKAYGKAAAHGITPRARVINEKACDARRDLKAAVLALKNK